MTHESLIERIHECNAKMGELKDTPVRDGNGTQLILVATDLLAEQAKNALEAASALASVRAEALEEAASYHDGEAAKYQKRLDRQAGRRDIPAIEAGIGGRVIGFGGTEVARYREALQDEVSSHRISAKRIRALIPEKDRAS